MKYSSAEAKAILEDPGALILASNYYDWREAEADAMDQSSCGFHEKRSKDLIDAHTELLKSGEWNTEGSEVWSLLTSRISELEIALAVERTTSTFNRKELSEKQKYVLELERAISGYKKTIQTLKERLNGLSVLLEYIRKKGRDISQAVNIIDDTAATATCNIKSAPNDEKE